MPTETLVLTFDLRYSRYINEEVKMLLCTATLSSSGIALNLYIQYTTI